MSLTKEQVQSGVHVRVNNPNIGARQYDPLHGHAGTIQPAYENVEYDPDIDSAWVVFESPVTWGGAFPGTCESCWMYLNNLELI